MIVSDSLVHTLQGLAGRRRRCADGHLVHVTRSQAAGKALARAAAAPDARCVPLLSNLHSVRSLDSVLKFESRICNRSSPDYESRVPRSQAICDLECVRAIA